MTVVVTHTTPADGSFSTTGAAAWNANHTLSGVGTMAGQDANAVAITGGSISGVSGVVTSVTGTAPVVSSGGATPVISMAAATASVNGYLTSTDWTTFNNKGSGTVTSVGGTGSVNGLTLSGTVTSSGNLTFGGTLDLSSPPAIGSTAANTGAFTTLSASSTVSGTGFSTYLASPPAIGSTTASTGRFTTVTSTVATGTAPFTVASTTAVANLSIGGNAGTVTNGVYTTDTGTVTNTMLAGSIANAKLTNSSITFGSTAQALGSTVSAISGVTIDNGAIGGTTAAAGTFTTLIGGSGSANYEQITGGATGKAVQFQSLGSDAAVSLAIQSKSTGAIDLAAGSSGVNISNGGTVTTLTRTAGGAGYTSYPSVAISAPTTAGGVQATATCTVMFNITATIASGGTGYTVGDTLTMVGGTPTSTGGTFTVSSVSSGAVTGVTAGSKAYTALPSNPVSTTVSPAGGTGCTLNVAYSIDPGGLTIGTAGSGYVEQPTVTISGGGGTGGTAYASVGAGSIIRALGSTGTQSLDFYTPASTSNAVPSLRIRDTVTDSYPLISNTSSNAIMVAQGNANATFALGANGTGSVKLTTSGTNNTEQLRVSHTASAVNYVQVTGAATGGTVNISAQGSDGNISLSLQSKATGAIRFLTGNGAENFRVNPVSSTVNYISASGSIAGASPSFASSGSDADINLTLVPKGLGIVLMNQQTPAAVTATGTLTIANLLTQIITSTSATAVSLTLPTGTLSDAGVSGGTSAVNTSFDYSIINTGSAVGDVTMVAGTAHTIVGSVSVPVGTTGRFKCRKTATNTFVSYRV
jgi:hypothetical protein